LRVPEWGAALLEEWLMSMRGAVNRPKDKVQRTNEIKRMQLSVQRNLESAGLSNVQSEIKALDERVDRVDARLAN